VQHELHAARLVEKPLEDDRLLRRNCVERRAAVGDVGDDLLGGRRSDACLAIEPLVGGPPGGGPHNL